MTENITDEIKELKEKRNAVILAHNYQRPEIQDIADFVGDSLALSRQAADTKAERIVFCGVHFMAETAYILSPQKTVLLPDANAGCPMADMINADLLRKLKEENPGVPVVTYVNSSAQVKALSDICCTSSNAIKVVESLPDEKVIFTPDKNLGAYVAKQTNKQVILWKGYCPTHHFIKDEQIKKLKNENPDAVFMAHPECGEQVLELAEYIGSTSQMFDWAKKTDAQKIIVGTEMGMLYKLKKDSPEKIFIAPTADTICPNMKLITLEKVKRSLERLEPVITVDEEIRLKALKAVEKMMAIG